MCRSLLVLMALLGLSATARGEARTDFDFVLAGDMSRYVGASGNYGWDRACEKIAEIGPGAFLVSPGDLNQEGLNPPSIVYDTIEAKIGAGYPFFPGVGNHELDPINEPVLQWIRDFDKGGPSIPVNPGPPGSENTTYSWDYGQAHFVMLNECFDGVDDSGTQFYYGNWNNALGDWLEADLSSTTKPLIFVFGHFQAWYECDRDISLCKGYSDPFHYYQGGVYRRALWDILTRHNVTAYGCGHTHTTSVEEIEGVWQLDQGHARGPGQNINFNGWSTFLIFHIRANGAVIVDTWRQIDNVPPYSLCHTDTLRQADPQISWANLQWPPLLTTTSGTASDMVYGQVWIDGVTSQPGAASGLAAELGYGPDGSDPTANPGTWQWTSAVYNLDVGNNDEFMASITVVSPGTYDYCFRYSFGASAWVYGDLDGSQNGYSPDQAGVLTVSGATDAPEAMPTVMRLYPNQPNPFNPQTAIKYDVPADVRTTLRVFDVRGALVRT